MEEPGQNPEAANFVVENDNTEEQFDDNIVDEMLEPEKEKFHPPGVLEFIDPAMYGEDPMEPGGSAPREMTIEDLICSDDGDEGSSASLYDPGSRGQSCGKYIYHLQL